MATYQKPQLIENLGKFSPNRIRNRRAALLDNTTTYYDLLFRTVPIANKEYYFNQNSKFLVDNIVTGIELFPNLLGTAKYNGFNVIIPFDYPNYLLTLRNSKQEIILDKVPFVSFSTFGSNYKNTLFMLEGVDMRYSFITCINPAAVITPRPFVIPFMFTYH